MPELILYLIVAIGFAAIPAALVGWTAWIVGWWKGRPLLPAEPRRPAPWGLGEILVTVGVFFVLQNAFVAAAVAAGWIAAPSPENGSLSAGGMFIAAASQGLTVVLAVGIIRRWSGGTLTDLGFSLRRLGRDVAIGVVASVMLLPPVMAIQAAMTQILPYEHQVLNLLEEADGWTIFSAFFAAVVVAPLAEEFFFRVLLQGWLQRLASSAGTNRSPAEGDREALGAEPSGAEESAPASEPSDRSLHERADDSIPPAWPILVTSALFALAHWGQGLAPVSLFFLACGLGYLYRQTGRIWAPLVVHVVLNSLTLAVVLLSQMVEIPGAAP